MTFVPDFDSACDLATTIPDYVADFLNLDGTLGRKFREESISDLIVASLIKLPYDGLVTIVPDEIRTGSDFDIIVVDHQMKDAVQFRIQAKKLSPHKEKWRMGSYKELAHPENTGRQASTLIRSSAHEKIPTFPLYAFYNAKHVCEKSGNIISGVELADGRQINELVKAMVRAKPKRLPYKRLATLQSLFFPLKKILCEPFHSVLGGDTRRIPPPAVFRDIVQNTISQRRKDYHWRELQRGIVGSGTVEGAQAADRIDDLKSAELETRLAKKAESLILPRSLLEIIEHRTKERIIRAKVARPRLIFISTELP